MTFTDSIKICLAKYVTWQGRASRSEFWFFFLFAVGSALVASIIDGILGTNRILYMLVALGLFLPNLSVMVRRLHDTGRSGWWYWIALVPIVGAIVLIVWFATKGTTGDNEYGADPLGGDLVQAFS